MLPRHQEYLGNRGRAQQSQRCVDRSGANIIQTVDEHAGFAGLCPLDWLLIGNPPDSYGLLLDSRLLYSTSRFVNFAACVQVEGEHVVLAYHATHRLAHELELPAVDHGDLLAQFVFLLACILPARKTE